MKPYYTLRVEINRPDRISLVKIGPQNEQLGQEFRDLGLNDSNSHYEEMLSLAAGNRRGELQANNIGRLGELLFLCTFDDVATRNFVEFYRQVTQERDSALRIDLVVDEKTLPDIATLPWELMRVPPSANLGSVWLGTEPNIIFSRRSIQAYQPQDVALKRGEQLRVGVIIASPADLKPVESESTIQALIELASMQGLSIDLLTPNFEATPEGISDTLKQRPHILHFIGHGRPPVEDSSLGEIALVDSLNRAKWVDADYFSELFNQHRPRVIVLQACQGATSLSSQGFVSIAARLANQNIPLVVAMQFDVSNSVASRFSRKFYKEIADGRAVDQAVQVARRAIALGPSQYNTRDFSAAVLFTNVQDGHLFSVRSGSDANETQQRDQNGSTQILSYSDLHNIATKQQGRYLAEIKGDTANEPYSPYIEGLYTSRDEVEAQIHQFLGSNKTGLILTGDSGCGKTNVFCALSEKLIDASNPVLFYNLGSSVQEDILAEVAEDLGCRREEVSKVIHQAANVCFKNNKQLVLFFDAVNEFRIGHQLSAGTALRAIDNFIAHNPYPGLKVLISCRTSTWNQLEMQNATVLLWRNYYTAELTDKTLPLGQFSALEFQKAYPKYRSKFNLSSAYDELSEFTRRRCRDPFLLRILSEIYAQKVEPIPNNAPSYETIKKYYQTKVTRQSDGYFLSRIVQEMYTAKRDRLSLNHLLEEDYFRDFVLDNSLSSPFHYLKSSGIIKEVAGFIKFTHDRVLEYVMAQSLLIAINELPDPQSRLSELAQEARAYTPLWGAVKNILLERRDFLDFSRLARAEDLSVRKILSESLVELFRDDSELGLEFMNRLLSANSDVAQRTVLESAYYLGQAAEEIFLKGAVHTSQTVRETVRGYLFMLWNTDPEFCLSVTRKIISEISVASPSKSITRLSFVMDYWSLLLINNCWRAEVMKEISDQVYMLLVSKLHVDKIAQVPFGEQIMDIFFSVGGRVISEKVFKTVTFDEYFPVEKFFLDDRPIRATYNRLVWNLQPNAALPQDAETELVELLEDDIPLYKLLAVLIIIGHILKDYPRYRPLTQSVFNKLSGSARYWFLSAFSLYIPVLVPEEYITLIEGLTQRFLEENRETFLQRDKSALYIPGLEFIFLPYGLARLMRNLPLTYLEKVIQRAYEEEDWELMSKCVEYLAPLGVYYPDQVLSFLHENVNFYEAEGTVKDAYLTALATIRTMHLEKVDGYLERYNFESVVRQDVFFRTQIDLIGTHLYGLGLYNNAINMFLWHPIMLKTFSLSIYEILAEVNDVSEFVTKYSETVYEALSHYNWRFYEMFDFDQEELQTFRS